MTIKIVPNEKGNPPGKLADAELHFTQGPLEGLKLIGFAVWERKTGNGRNVTFPARQYSVNGERRSFSLLRPIVDATSQDRIRDLILQAYAEYEAQTVDRAGRRRSGGRAGRSRQHGQELRVFLLPLRRQRPLFAERPCRTPPGRTTTSCRRR